MFKLARSFGKKIAGIFSTEVDEEALESFEELLVTADLGMETATELSSLIRKGMRRGKTTAEAILQEIRAALLTTLQQQSPELSTAKPTVLFIVGVNGNGKTTTCAKLAHYFQRRGESVLLGAADTFRAAAIEQLTLWAERLDIPLVKHKAGSDPAAVVFDTVSAGLSRGIDRIIIDTAGRLHNKSDLMGELAKMQRVAGKVLPDSPHETLLVLDATTGQNAIDQAKAFHASTPLTGVILTKLDGSAKGGMAVAIQKQLGLPIKFVGTGEGAGDLAPFSAEAFVEALLR
ncbi:MAG: signal recognition particle-docking protein FtsY [Parachlamydiales bacterium]